MKKNTNDLTRKDFIEMVVKSSAAFSIAPLFPPKYYHGAPIKAIAFNAYTLFDTGSVVQTAQELFPGKANELMMTWRTKQFEYTWLRGYQNSIRISLL